MSALPRRTKIIATIGPATETKEHMHQLLHSGVNIFRFNMKHNSNSWHEEHIALARKVSKEESIPLGILIDLQGPEIRVKTHEDSEFSLSAHEEFILTSDKKHLNKDEKILFVSEEAVIKCLEKDDKFSIDDGKLSFRVSRVEKDKAYIIALHSMTVASNKTLNLIGKDLAIPSLAISDLKKLDIAKTVSAEFVALSFVRGKKDLDELKKELTKRHISPKIIAKVESQSGVENIYEIVDNSDVIMVARGDLGVETPIEKLTLFQKKTIELCRKKVKSVIIATQMLESMITNPIPTRAEAADVSNAVFDSTDATMLSGETATGHNAVLAAQTMARILHYNEGYVVHPKLVLSIDDNTKRVAEAVLSANDLKKIIAITSTGYTAKVLSALRPNVPIIAVTDSVETFGQLSICYGVQPYLTTFPVGKNQNFDQILSDLIKKGLLKTGEEIAITHGQNFGTPGKTDSLVFLKV